MAEQLGEAVLTVSADTRQLEAGLQRSRQQAEQAGSRIEGAFNGIGNALRNLGALVGVVGIGALTQQIISTGQESERSKIQLNALAGAYGEAAQAAQSVARIQGVLGISALEARQNFSQLYASLRGTGIGVQQLEVLFVGLNKAAQLSGASTAEAAGGLLQLRQGLASGVLQGDELRSVLENLPVFAQAVAKEMGVNVGELRKLGSEGKITSGIIFNAAKNLANATVPARAQAESLGIAFTNLKEKAAEAFGPAIIGLVTKVAAGMAAFSTFVEANKASLTALGQSIVGLGKTLAPLVIGILAVRTALGAWALASKAVAVAQAAVLALSGPQGLILLAAGTLAAAAAAKGLEVALKGISDAGGKAGDAAKKAAAEFQATLKGVNLNPVGGPPPQTQQQLDALRKQADAERQGQFAAATAALKLQATRQQIALELQSLRTGQQISATSQAELSIQQSIADAKLQQANAQKALQSELSKPTAQVSKDVVASLTRDLAKANADVRQAYADAGLSLFQNARAAADALKSAQQGFDSAARGGFQFLTTEQQQKQLLAARVQVQKGVDAGLIRSGVDVSTPEKLFQLAGLSDSLVNGQKALQDAIKENASATTTLARKDWNVYVAAGGSLPQQQPPQPQVVGVINGIPIRA
jgi:tape measure domain-containing protein